MDKMLNKVGAAVVNLWLSIDSQLSLNPHLTPPAPRRVYLASCNPPSMIINFNDNESARLNVLQDSRKIKQLINWLHAIDQAKNLKWNSDVCVDIFLDHNDISVHVNQKEFRDAVKELYLAIPDAEPLD